MQPSSKIKKVVGITAILSLPILFLFLFNSGRHNFVRLPIYGPKVPVANGDTIYHTIPYFSFIDQNKKVFSQDSLEGKIYVANFIFTRCPSICPNMTAKMTRLEWKLDDPSFADIALVSHTVDPEYDTPEVLNDYAYEKRANTDKWSFLTGDKTELYTLGAEGYFLAASEDVLAPGGFLHSEKFVLVDRQKRIRGYYDGTNIEDVDRLFDEIRILLKEEKIDARNAREQNEQN